VNDRPRPPDQPGDVCFLPRRGEFAVEATGLAESVRELSVYEDRALVQTIAVESAARLRTHFRPATAARSLAAPYAAAQAIIQIDGVTRWTKGSLSQLAYGRPRQSVLSWHDYRWLVTPTAARCTANRAARRLRGLNAQQPNRSDD
jgi:hypothetical protein